MNAVFGSEISEKSNKELLDIFKRPEEYQDIYIDLVEKELHKRELNNDQIKVEFDRSHWTKWKFPVYAGCLL